MSTIPRSSLVPFLVFFVLFAITGIPAQAERARSAEQYGLATESYWFDPDYYPPGTISRNDWMPKCCYSSYRSQNAAECTQKATAYRSYFGASDLGEKTFWNLLCWPNGTLYEYKRSDSDPGLDAYENGFIGFHDTQYGNMSSKSIYKGLAVLLDGYDHILSTNEVNELTDEQLDLLDVFRLVQIHKMENRYSDIDYQLVIGLRTGRIYQGRPLPWMGASMGSPKEIDVVDGESIFIDADISIIGIALSGDKLTSQSQSDVQDQAGTLARQFYMKRFAIPLEHVMTHNYIGDTDCTQVGGSSGRVHSSYSRIILGASSPDDGRSIGNGGFVTPYPALSSKDARTRARLFNDHVFRFLKRLSDRGAKLPDRAASGGGRDPWGKRTLAYFEKQRQR